MISFHFGGACRSTYSAINNIQPLLRSANINPIPLCRTFASKRPPSRKHNAKTSADLSAKHNIDQELDRREHNKPYEYRSRNQSPKKLRKKEWKRPGKREGGTKILQKSGLLFDLSRRDGDDDHKSPQKIPIVFLDASPLLDPLMYCKTSAKIDHTRGVSQSISGTDAARRLLRGKKDFITVARTMRSPGLLAGHGIPPELLQHCIDMADALMQYYGDDTVEISFHNYNHENYDETKLPQIPQILRIRGQDGTNRCSSWPMPTKIDWDYHMSLYVTVMERLVRNLGLVLPSSSETHQPLMGDDESEWRNRDDFTASPLLFPTPNHIPHWNVDILRGGVLQFYDENDGTPKNDIKPFPIIVEFSPLHEDSETRGHVLIRLQGNSLPNRSFDIGSSGKRVSLVFDACFR